MGVAHIRVDLQGTLCSGAEKWSAGFSTAPPGGGGDADCDALAATALTIFTTNYFSVSAVNNTMPVSAAFGSVRVQQLRADGTVQNTGVAILTTPVAGSVAYALPPQCAIVASLRTPIAGARGRGRMYLPVLGYNKIDENGRMTTTVRDALGSNLAAALQAWNDDPSTAPVGVASNVGGFVTSVTSLQIGNIVDTQRRRRDALPESYYGASVTP